MAAIRLKLTADVEAFDDPSTEQVKLFGPLTTYLTRTVDTMSKVTSGKLDIAASGSMNLPVGDIADPRGYVILADGDFNLTFNGGAEVLNIKRSGSATSAKAISFQEADFTSVSIANPSLTTALTAIFVVWGDPV